MLAFIEKKRKPGNLKINYNCKSVSKKGHVLVHSNALNCSIRNGKINWFGKIQHKLDACIIVTFKSPFRDLP